MVEVRIVCQSVLENLRGKKSLERCKCRCQRNNKMGVRDVGIENGDWIHVAVDLCQNEAV
jgi:hypothetical protein